jgi:hypothetical protein
MSVSFFDVTKWVFDSGFAKALEPQETGVAFAAGEAFRRGIVATVCDRKVDTELGCFPDNFGLREFD